MSLFKRKPKPDKYIYYIVEIKYHAVVMAKNEFHAVNTVRDVRSDFYEATHKYLGKYAIHEESVKARKAA